MLLLVSQVLAGYGDSQDGYPSRDERWLHLWTNAARVAPEEFVSDYAVGGCSLDVFSADEKTPKAPLYLDYALTEVAREHSEDMATHGCFQHESCDGTDTWTRIGNYYTEGQALGENIAMGSGIDGRYAVLSMWMCSESGHRANIMSGDFNELGVGAASGSDGNYFTQDFAGGQLNEGNPPVRMASDDGSDGFYADWGDSAAPVRMDLVVAGKKTAMKLVNGTEKLGIWYAKGSLSEACNAWWISWETQSGDTGTFPENGAYQLGDCSGDWVASKSGVPNVGGGDDSGVSADPNDDIHLTGCNTAPATVPYWGLFGLMGLRYTRRESARRRHE